MPKYIEIVEEDERFEFVIDGYDAVFTLRRFGTLTYREIEERHTRKRRNRVGDLVSEINGNAVNDDLLDYMIVGWKGVISSTTQEEIPCTRETKLGLPFDAKLKIIEACDVNSISTEEKKRKNAKT